MSTVAIIGANGQLGSDCVQVFGSAGFRVVELNHDRLEIADAESVRRVLGDVAPDVVVNTAAYHNVEGCEFEPESAFRVNALGSRNLGKTAQAMGFKLLHVSTDYVFDGSKGSPYLETDLPAPLNVYGTSKLSGEYLLLAENPSGMVVRTCGLYGRSSCRAKQGGLNFVQRMLQLASERGSVQVVTDEIVTPTHTLDLAHQLVELAGSNLSGVVHATAGGECSWFDFAKEIFSLSGVSVRLEPTTAAAFPSKVKRPSYSVLENRRLQEAGLDRMPHWKESLASYLEVAGLRHAYEVERT